MVITCIYLFFLFPLLPPAHLSFLLFNELTYKLDFASEIPIYQRRTDITTPPYLREQVEDLKYITSESDQSYFLFLIENSSQGNLPSRILFCFLFFSCFLFLFSFSFFFIFCSRRQRERKGDCKSDEQSNQKSGKEKYVCMSLFCFCSAYSLGCVRYGGVSSTMDRTRVCPSLRDVYDNACPLRLGHPHNSCWRQSRILFQEWNRRSRGTVLPLWL